MCRVLKVSPSGYYEWSQRDDTSKNQRRKTVLEQVNRVYQESRKRYGSPRIYRQLKSEGLKIGRHRVAKAMQELGLVARKKRHYRRPVSERHDRSFAKNILDRQFKVLSPNRTWACDVSYFWTKSGWIHLAIVMDLYSRRIIGWAMRNQVDKELTTSALEMALLSRKPVRPLIHHSDQGAEYTNKEYQGIVKDNRMVASMSRPRECYDNAVVESFFKTIKTELVKHQTFKTREEARSAIFEYIEIFYNRRRLHSTLGYVSPVDFEKQDPVN